MHGNVKATRHTHPTIDNDMSEQTDRIVEDVFKRMAETSKARLVSDPFDAFRKAASARVQSGEDFMNIADEFKISARTLLAWNEYEVDSKWGDPHLPEWPGPTDQYTGDWPSPMDELDLYASRDINPKRIRDPALRRRYQRFLNKRKASELPGFWEGCKSGEMTPLDELMAVMDEDFGGSESEGTAVSGPISDGQPIADPSATADPTAKP